MNNNSPADLASKIFSPFKNTTIFDWQFSKISTGLSCASLQCKSIGLAVSSASHSFTAQHILIAGRLKQAVWEGGCWCKVHSYLGKNTQYFSNSRILLPLIDNHDFVIRSTFIFKVIKKLIMMETVILQFHWMNEAPVQGYEKDVDTRRPTVSCTQKVSPFWCCFPSNDWISPALYLMDLSNGERKGKYYITKRSHLTTK